MKIILKKYGNTVVAVFTKDMLKAHGINGPGSIVDLYIGGVDNSKVKEIDLEDEE